MPKPPKSTPHSDLDGVREDELPNVETAIEASQDSADLARAHRESAARPSYSDSAKDKSRGR